MKYTYYSARKELNNMFWTGMIDGNDFVVMEYLLWIMTNPVTQ